MRHMTFATLTLVLALLLVTLVPCSGLAAKEPTEAEKQEALERLQLLRQELIELQSELARMKEDKAREERAARVTSDDPIWRAMPGLDHHPKDYGLYGYVLITPRTLQQDAIALLTLLETGPGSEADKTINSTIFVVPCDDKDGRIMIENYKEVLANRLLKSAGMEDATGPVILLTIAPFTEGTPQHVLGIDLGSQKAASIQSILQLLLKSQPIGEEPDKRFRDLAWQLTDVDPHKRTVIGVKGDHLQVSWSH